MRTRHAAHAAALALAAIVFAGCSITTEGPDNGDSPSAGATTAPADKSGDGTSGADDDAGSTEDRSPDILPEERTWLYEIDSDANFDSGGQISVAVAGGDGAEHADSTSQWLGCDGVAAVTTYQLDGGYTSLHGTLAFREGTPQGLLAEVLIETDLGVLGNYQVDSDGGLPLQLLVEGANTLTVTAEVSEGTCGNDTVGYLVFADAYLT